MAAYPLYGTVTLDPDMPLADALAQRDGAFGAAVDPTLLARLDLQPGARLTIGDATIEIVAALKSEPDKLASGIAFGPRVIVSEAALRATGLLSARQPGALALSPAAAGRQRPRRAGRGDGGRRRNFPTPAGRSAPAPTPRRRSSATSSASRNISRWSA